MNETKNWTTNEVRKKYLDFFKAKNHAIIPGAPVVPKEDPTVLFTTAGMHPLVPYLMGQAHPEGKRIANVQVCIRTTDIDDVGDDTHLTAFEMLGNWSLGDYFKEEAIAMSWEFLTSKDYLGINPSLLAISCFEDDETVSKDTESAEIWQKLGVPEDRIFYYGRDDNWWGPAGETGPCGPDTEMFYWAGDGEPKGEPATNSDWVEIWNDVFMQFDKRDDGTYEPLKQKNVDTGMGLERTVAVLNGFGSVFEVDNVKPIYDKVVELANIKFFKIGFNNEFENDTTEKSKRIITDHLRAAVILVASGVNPTNVDRGYVLRRLIRRAIRHGRLLGINKGLIEPVAEIVIDTLKNVVLEIDAQKKDIITTLVAEEDKFSKTIERGLREFEKVAQAQQDCKKELDGATTFKLYDTYGFPLEMTQELADERGLIVDIEGFNQAFKNHQEKSRTATAGTFASGLADDSEQVVKYHTATHLLHQALRQVLGEQVRQKGSNITADRLRFDFTFDAKMTDEQKTEVENLVNEQIKAGLEVKVEEMSPDEAQKSGALGFFGDKYGDRVTVYSIGNFSKEICTGSHVINTNELGTFVIKKEESSSAGVRRIKAILE